MKQHFTNLIFAAFLPLAAYGQTIVSTTPENKKVILEEFTGINCVYCPDGHRIAKQIQDNNPGNVFLINVHQGGFATPQGSQPDYRTPFGNGIANQTGLTGYPSGTINRHVFSGNNTILDRGQWATRAGQILQQASYVNVGLESSIDAQSREMTINVEVYYTANSPVNTNKLNIALLQNNTKGPQTGGGQGNNYNHMHRLVHLLTGQWGEEITTTTSGTLVQKTYTYTIPESHNNIPIVFGDLELVAFVSESNQEIVSGNGGMPSYNNLPLDNDISIKSIADIAPECTGVVTPVIEIKNNGNDVLTSLAITYTLNSGTPQVYNWTGNLGGLQYETVTLPELAYTQDVNTLEISIPSDQDSENNTGSIQFNSAVESNGSLLLSVRTDQYPNEISWKLVDSEGIVIQQASYANNQQNQTFTYDIELTENCYTFILSDAYGDGGGPVSLKDSNGLVIYNTTGNYGSGASTNFASDGIMGVGDLNASNVQIYPNPSNGVFNVDAKQNSTVEVFNTAGQIVYKKSNVSGTQSIDISGKGKGIFVVKISDEKNTTTKKIVVQ